MNDITLFKSGLPSYLRGIDDTTANLADTGNNRRISVKGNVFREVVGGKEVRKNTAREMNIIIIKAAPAISRTYYVGAYSEDNVSAPDCWSADGVRPDPTAKNPQGNACRDCPMNAKGSGQGDTRACRFSQRLAVMLEGSDEVYQLVLSATSIFGDGVAGAMPLRAYASFLKANNAPISGVVTEMRFDLDSSTPKLFFRPIRHVTEAEWATVQELKDSDAAVRAVTMTVAQTDGVGAKPATPALAAPAPVAAPVVEVAETAQDNIPEPTKAAKPGAAPAPAPTNQKLADLVSDWGDDD